MLRSARAGEGGIRFECASGCFRVRMQGYSVREVGKLLNLSDSQVRAYARAGLLDASRGARGEYRFSFQDLVLLRTAKGLVAARIPAAKVRRALRRLRQQLPQGRPLSGVQIVAEGDRVLVRSGERIWNPVSGQGHFNFEVAELVEQVARHTRRMVDSARRADRPMRAEDWYELGFDLEAVAPDESREAYRRALELAPRHVAAHINLGRLLHEARELEAAEAHFRIALEESPGNPAALNSLGVSLEDLGRRSEAMDAYREAVRLDPAYADAWFHLARLAQRLGDDEAAVGYLERYRGLVDDA